MNGYFSRMQRLLPLHVAALGALLLLLGGCFETEFHFDTRIQPDGTVIRKTRIEGRGATLFEVPSGKGWKTKTWETRGEKTLISEVISHVQAEGRFKAGQEIPSDYAFNLEKQSAHWQEKDKKRLEEAGIKPPYEAQIFSHNQIRIQQIKGWFTVTTFYEETFETAGVLALLFQDLKEEIRREGEGRGQVYQLAELEAFAKLRIEEEILPEFHFESEVELPGKILTTNGQQLSTAKTVWKFSMKDFQKDFSSYKLTASSEAFRLSGFLFAGLCLALLAGFLILGVLGRKIYKRDLFGPGKPKKKEE